MSGASLGNIERADSVPLNAKGDVDVDANPEYWRSYSNLQHIKHELIRRYLGGWFPKLGSWAGRVLYVDTHAGRGRHLSGELGSPLVALRTLLTHRHRDRLLRSSEFAFHFIERDEGNLEALKGEISNLGGLPGRIIVVPHAGECFSVLKKILAGLRKARSTLAPAFVFVDPYGFKVPGSILRELMQAGRVELFVNLMWRELDMELAQVRKDPERSGWADLVFDGVEWRREIDASSTDERADQAVNLLARKLSGRWPTFIRMLDKNRTRYILLHLTNHDEGRDLMKECVWKVSPEGGFFVRKSDDPAQQILISPDPDLRPLRSWILEQLGGTPLRWSKLHARARSTVWLESHVNDVVRGLRRSGEIVASRYSGTFSAKADPLLSVARSDRLKS